MDILSNFVEMLSDLISDNHLTPETFSAAIDIDRSSVYKYLRGETLPSLSTFIVIADYFHCSADYLLGLIPENPKTTYKPAPPFSQRFQEILAKNNMTRYRLKQETSFPRKSIDDWFLGRRVPFLDNVVKLANHFHCSVDYLLGRES